MCPISQCDNRICALFIFFYVNLQDVILIFWKTAYNYLFYCWLFHSSKIRAEGRNPFNLIEILYNGIKWQKECMPYQKSEIFHLSIIQDELRRKCILSIILYILFNQFKILSWKCVLWAILSHRKLITFITIAIKLW